MAGDACLAPRRIVIAGPPSAGAEAVPPRLAKSVRVTKRCAVRPEPAGFGEADAVPGAAAADQWLRPVQVGRRQLHLGAGQPTTRLVDEPAAAGVVRPEDRPAPVVQFLPRRHARPARVVRGERAAHRQAEHRLVNGHEHQRVCRCEHPQQDQDVGGQPQRRQPDLRIAERRGARAEESADAGRVQVHPVQRPPERPAARQVHRACPVGAGSVDAAAGYCDDRRPRLDLAQRRDRRGAARPDRPASSEPIAIPRGAARAPGSPPRPRSPMAGRGASTR